MLLAASYYFYARWNGWYVFSSGRSPSRDFAIAIALERASPSRENRPDDCRRCGKSRVPGHVQVRKLCQRGRSRRSSGCIENPWLVRLIVPIGISFHTFQSISYLVDVYRGKHVPAMRDPFDYALYLAFFPQLLAGPIVRAGLFFAELFAWRKPSAADVATGACASASALVKKTGDRRSVCRRLRRVFRLGGSPSGVARGDRTATFAFAMQIYFDFSGYSDIAIGCARLFGFVFPENFRSTVSRDERWRFLAPLAHHAVDVAARLSIYSARRQPARSWRDVRNLMLTMVLGGLWHGAQWTFVAWGGYQGALLCVERLAGISAQRDAAAGTLEARVQDSDHIHPRLLRLGAFRAQHFSLALDVYPLCFRGGAGRRCSWAGRGPIGRHRCLRRRPVRVRGRAPAAVAAIPPDRAGRCPRRDALCAGTLFPAGSRAAVYLLQILNI